MIAKIAGKPPIKKSMSKKTAMTVAKIMVFLNKVIGIKPWVTPMAVDVLTNDNKVSIDKARKLLKYEPKIDFNKGMKKVEEWLRQDG
jgi:nucleoside-diphosphate-sugar epimerase